ncbi:MAG: response regulator [Hydrogenophilaceae bacterium]|nr:response regulator [Hydrogenophilaceae bacterium]
MKVRTQVYLLGFVPMMVVGLLLGGYLIQGRLADMERASQQRGEDLAQHMAQHVEHFAETGPLTPERLTGVLREMLAEEDVLYVRVRSPQGELIGEAVAAESLARYGRPLWPGDDRQGHFVAMARLPEAGLAGPVGNARVELTLSQARYWQSIRTMIWAGLSIMGLGLLVAGFSVHRLIAAGLRPLMEVIATVRRIAGGERLPARLVPSELDEIGQLQQGIKQMAESLESLRDNMRQRVAEATAELARQKETAELANRAKSRFLAAASHDLRQPMHAIGLFAAALQPHVTTEEGKAILGKIQSSLVATEGLFSTVLDVSKLDAGIITPQLARISVSRLLERLRDDFQYEAASKGLSLKVHGLPVQVTSDPVLLDRILRNLVTNALRYTDRGGVLIAARRRGDTIRFQVWDSGIGIPSEHFADIFSEFYQVQTLKRDRAKGLGLGLAIVDRLVRLLNHHLEVRSVPGKGTVFNVDVPLASADSSQYPVANEVAAAAYARLHGRVLVVDDDESVLDALVALLRGWGLDVIMARSGAEALAQVAQPPSLVLTDYRLSIGETGLDVVERLRQLFRGAEFPVVVVTGDTTEVGMRAVADQGYALLHKPVQPAKLRALVTRLLRREAASA